MVIREIFRTFRSRLLQASLCLMLLIPSVAQATRSEASAHIPVSNRTDKTLARPGAYILADNTEGPISIIGSNIILDLNGYKVTREITSANPEITPGIVVGVSDLPASVVEAMFPRISRRIPDYSYESAISHIIVRNGSVENITSACGVSIETNCTDITVENVRVSDCVTGICASDIDTLILKNDLCLNNEQKGIDIIDSSRCSVILCRLNTNDIGIQLTRVNDAHIDQCVAFANTSEGIALDDCNRVVVTHCTSLLTGSGSTNTSIGFSCEGGSQNTFTKCLSEGTTTASTQKEHFAAGFVLGNSVTRSSISECTSSNTTTPASGSSIAYGIRLRETFPSLTEIDSGNRGTAIESIAWSLSGNYAAAGGASLPSGDVSIYRLNLKNETLTPVEEIAILDPVHSVAWDMDDTHLAIGSDSSSDDVWVYSFNEQELSFTFDDKENHGKAIQAVTWNETGRFIVAMGVVDGGKGGRLYEFSRTNNSLSKRQDVNHNAEIKAAAFQREGVFLASCGAILSGDEIHLFELDPGAKTLTLRSSVSHGTTAYSLGWSPNGNFLVVGGDTGTGGFDIRLYEFDSVAKTLTLRDSETHGAIVRSVTWSPDGQYVAIGGSTASGFEIRVYKFDEINKTLTLTTSATHGSTINSVSWSPSGDYLLAAGGVFGGKTHHLYRALHFPLRCVIRKNAVYGTTGGSEGKSTGIYGSGATNLVVQNITYNNDQNYRFAGLVKDQHDTEKTTNISGSV